MDDRSFDKPIEAMELAKKEVASYGGSDAASIGAQIDIISAALRSYEMKPPSVNTADFVHQGDEIEIPAPSIDGPGLERIIDESDFLPANFLEQGAIVQRAVARVVLTKPHAGFPAGTGWATGFLVAPSLFLTNNHVIPDKAFANKIRMQFNFQLNDQGVEATTDSYHPDADDVFHTNAALDYTLIRLQSKPVSGDATLGTGMIVAGQRWGFIHLNPAPVYREKQHFNIVQHPDGRMKEVALQDNEIHSLFTNAVRYKTDTEPGSSGSPVLDNVWQLMALHHAGGERVDGTWINNQGIRSDRIVEDLQSAFGASDSGRSVLQELGLPMA